ncbi:MAG: chromosome partitioning protein ParA, partial [Muribaculum sp.]|nr:chromosome partitioning protein ParA [Muribaculum sp.]
MSEISDNIEQQDSELRIKDFLNLCIVNWKWFVLSIGLAVCLAVVYIARQEPSYTRMASIMIKEDSKNRSFASELSSFGDLGLFSSASDVHNELIAIQSPAILLETIKRLNLNTTYFIKGGMHRTTLYGQTLPIMLSFVDVSDNTGCSVVADISENGNTVKLSDFTMSGDKRDISDYEVSGAIGDTLSTPLGRVVVTKTPFFDVADTSSPIHIKRSSYSGAIDSFKSKLHVSLNSDKADIIDIEYTDVSTQRAEDVLNMLIAVYNETWVKDKNQIAVSTSQFIDDRLNVIERELGNVDSDISSYKSEHLLPDVAMVSSMYMDQASNASNQALELNNQLYMARYVREIVSKDNSGQLLPVNSGIGSAALEHQIDEYNSKILERNTLLANSSENNPLVIDLNKAIAEMRRAIATSIDNQISALQIQLASYRDSERKSNAKISSNPTQAKYLLSVERQQKVKESLYLFLLQKREENELSQAFTAYNTRTITPPMGNDAPTAPIKMNILFVAVAAGILLPAFILFVRETLNNKVRGRKDMEVLSVPFIGEIPQYGASKAKRSLIDKIFSITRPDVDSPDRRAIVVSAKKRNSITEAFRVIRT